MPKFKRGSGYGSHGHKAKGGTKNKEQAAKRDERAAAAAAADRAAARELLADLAMQEDEHIASPQTVARPRTVVPGQRERWRAMIIWKYVELGCPPKKQWKGRGGTVATISRFLEQRTDADTRPVMDVLSKYVSNEAQVASRLGVQQKLTEGESRVVVRAPGANGSRRRLWESPRGSRARGASRACVASTFVARKSGGEREGDTTCECTDV